MKKLRLNVNAFDKGEVLSRAQLKRVMGGTGGSLGAAPVCKDNETACKYVDANGKSEDGFCASYGHMEGDTPIVECYCQTKNHNEPTPLKKDSVCELN